jgi:hypothetical protein
MLVRSDVRRVVVAIAASAICLAAATTPGEASTLVADGVTYSLTGVAITATHDQFTLNISGINGASDTEKFRIGVHAFAFNPPANFSNATASGFTFNTGGLNSGGCSGSGNFFCFDRPKPSGSALSPNSTLSLVFDVFLTSGTFANWKPDFKIDWTGTPIVKNNGKLMDRPYDLVSLELDPSFPPREIDPPAATPLPGALPLFAGGLAAFGLFMRRRKQKLAAA